MREKRRRFKIGDRVSFRHKQITGARKRPATYGYGTIVNRAPWQPMPPMHGGFHYVLPDGAQVAQLCYAGRLTHLDEADIR